MDYGINDEGIINLNNLDILNASNNSKITDINHTTKLRELNASGTCGIVNLDNLEILDMDKNYQIRNIKHMAKIRKIYAFGSIFRYDE